MRTFLILRKSLILLFIIALCTSSGIAQKGIQPEDYSKTVFISEPEISPGGDLAAFTRNLYVIDSEAGLTIGLRRERNSQ